MESVQLILGPSERLNCVEWFKCNERLHSEACMMDLARALVRMRQMKLFEVDFFHQRSKQFMGGVASMQLFTHVFLFRQTSGTVTWSMAHSNRVQLCVHTAQSCHEEYAINDGTPYPELQCHYV